MSSSLNHYTANVQVTDAVMHNKTPPPIREGPSPSTLDICTHSITLNPTPRPLTWDMWPCRRAPSVPYCLLRYHTSCPRHSVTRSRPEPRRLLLRSRRDRRPLPLHSSC